MKINSKVLIALDYDFTAQKIAETGFVMAKEMGAEIILLHLITDKTYYTALEYTPIKKLMGFSMADTSDLFEKNGLKKTMIHFLEKTKEHLADETIQILVKEGDFAETILKTAIEKDVDIIVIGSHSRKWLENIVMGSVTEKLLRLTTIPLYIIPTKKHNLFD
ncbi:MAG: universal stress protein [Bacteroidia bacterium]|nr:universal stress protein [Bacteroidia bacterium]